MYFYTQTHFSLSYFGVFYTFARDFKSSVEKKKMMYLTFSFYASMITNNLSLNKWNIDNDSMFHFHKIIKHLGFNLEIISVKDLLFKSLVFFSFYFFIFYTLVDNCWFIIKSV